ncbi:hypothetical protein E2P81_ATG06955 [Venturia nashicola]|nr:hypothetical protein E2P81_ATG06955 [Venturia nashicola]
MGPQDPSRGLHGTASFVGAGSSSNGSDRQLSVGVIAPSRAPSPVRSQGGHQVQSEARGLNKIRDVCSSLVHVVYIPCTEYCLLHTMYGVLCTIVGDMAVMAACGDLTATAFNDSATLICRSFRFATASDCSYWITLALFQTQPELMRINRAHRPHISYIILDIVPSFYCWMAVLSIHSWEHSGPM